MPAFTHKIVTPLELSLDLKNPRFILPNKGATETDIIRYLLDNEKIQDLCIGINKIGTILPGERIVICEENDKSVVLEGNRRICCCKLLLDRSLIPSGYNIPSITDVAKDNLTSIEVDVVPSREDAKKYLAARHINRVREWSTIAQMNFVSEEFNAGKSVDEIVEISSLKKSDINRFLRNSNLLRMGIEHGHWSSDEANQLALDHIISPDRYFRIFGVKGTKALGIKYDDQFVPHSYYLSDEDLYKIFAILVRGALIDHVFDTRNDFFDDEIQNLISPVLAKYRSNPMATPNNNEPNSSGNQNNYPNNRPEGQDVHEHDGNQGNSEPPCLNNEPNSGRPEPSMNPRPKPIKNLPLFSTLRCEIDNHNADYRGLIFIYNEIIRFSKSSNAKYYPIAAVMLTRSLIEHVMINFAKKKGKWEQLVKDASGKPENVKLGNIIKCFLKCKDQLFDGNISVKEHFANLFSEERTVNEMNWVIHQLNAFRMSFESLQNKVDEGLLEVIQYMIDQL